MPAQTAFHASFNNAATADTAVLKVSRGTSVVRTTSREEMFLLKFVDPAVGVRHVSALSVEVACVYV